MNRGRSLLSGEPGVPNKKNGGTGYQFLRQSIGKVPMPV